MRNGQIYCKWGVKTMYLCLQNCDTCRKPRRVKVAVVWVLYPWDTKRTFGYYYTRKRDAMHVAKSCARQFGVKVYRVEIPEPVSKQKPVSKQTTKEKK